MNSFVGSVFPGAVWAAFSEREAVVRAYGRMSFEPDAPPMSVDCIFDLASLTKVVATTMVLLSLAEDGYFDLDAPLDSFFPQVRGSNVTIRELLQHRSGLPDYFPMDRIPVGQEAQDAWIIDALSSTGGLAATRYSCLGFLLLQTIAERLGATDLNSLFQSRVAGPLGMTSSVFNPSRSLRDRIPPTERRDERRRQMESVRGSMSEGRFTHGEVHDPASFLRGGVSGNAGLFSTIGDVVRVGQCWLQEGKGICSSERFRAWITPQEAWMRGLGFDVAQPNGPVVAGGFSVGRAFGHNGFTGTSLWVDPDKGVGCALLSNRIHPTSERGGIEDARRHAIDLAIQTLS